jgi:hypothetical protein
MVKLKEDGTAPVSKYAAKKAARATKKEDVQPKVEETKVEESKVETKVEDTKPEVVQEAPAVAPTVPTPKANVEKTKPKTVVGKEKREINVDVPEHILEIAYIPKDNAAIRRYTSLNILNHLSQTGVIRKDGKGNFVKFLWNKFRVSSDGIIKEYSYREQFFLTALISAFSQFASNAQETIATFMEKEGIEEIK